MRVSKLQHFFGNAHFAVATPKKRIGVHGAKLKDEKFYSTRGKKEKDVFAIADLHLHVFAQQKLIFRQIPKFT
jgi:hypothetical protein